MSSDGLFIILFLHQTTTLWVHLPPWLSLFIILFLHQTTTRIRDMLFFFKLFIILFLHQTTTVHFRVRRFSCCLSSCSYIKPQRCSWLNIAHSVVYHLVPTSNHNPIAVNLLVISKILRFWLLRNGRAGRFLLQIY